MLEPEKALADDELASWLAFDQMTGIGLGPRKILQMYERTQSLVAAWEATARQMREYQWPFDDKLVNQIVAKRKEINPEALLNDLRKTDTTAWAYADPRFPQLLKHIHDPPALLYVRGRARDTDFTHTVGVVGTRRPTSYGQRIAKEMARGLSSSGVTVVSGLALGIDSLAHWGAIEGGGRTIAVLACGPDVCYPSSNKRLVKAILEDDRGLVMSEYFPGTQPDSWRFPARNRIVSGLSKALVVVEGNMVSGALITARMAWEQSRQVYAVPGRIDAEMSQGPNHLIKELQAGLVTDYKDVMKGLDWVTAGIVRDIPTVVELYGRERDVYELLSGEPVHFDVLCERTGMPAGEMSATLTMLELAGVAARHPGDWYSRVTVGIGSRNAPSLPTFD